MELTKRQKDIIEIIERSESITGEDIAKELNVTRSALRSDFLVLTNLEMIISRKRVGYSINKDHKKKSTLNEIGELEIKFVMSVAVNLEETVSVYDAIVTMFEKDVGSIFITKDNYLSGVISRKDLLKVSIGKRDITKIPIHLIMTRMPNVVFAFENDKIKDVARDLVKHQIDSLPVVREKKESEEKIKYEIVGRFTKTNITKLFVNM